MMWPPKIVPDPPIYIRAKYYIPQIGFLYCDFEGQILPNQTRPTDGIIEDNVSGPEIMNDVRTYRNTLLSNCDWTQLPDVPLDINQVNAWRLYRQALRDFPDTIDVDNWKAPDWPIPPS